MNRSQETARIVAFALEQDRLEKLADEPEEFVGISDEDWIDFRDAEEIAREHDAMMQAEYDSMFEREMREDDSWDRYDYSVYDPYDFV